MAKNSQFIDHKGCNYDNYDDKFNNHENKPRNFQHSSSVNKQRNSAKFFKNNAGYQEAKNYEKYQSDMANNSQFIDYRSNYDNNDDKSRRNFKNHENEPRNFQYRSSVNKQSTISTKFFKSNSGYEEETYNEEYMNGNTKNYEYYQSDEKIKLNPNVRYESQENYLKKYHQENPSFENKNGVNSSKVKQPTPLSKAMVKNSENKNSNGARKKLKANSDIDQANTWFCTDCEKVIFKKIDYHLSMNRDHKLLPYDVAMQELKSKEQNKILTTIEDANSQLVTEMQTKDIINLSEDNIFPCLSDVFKNLKVSNANNTKELHKIRDLGTQIINDNSIEKVTEMLQLMNFRSSSLEIITQSQKSLSDMKQNPCWLIFSWFKISIGLIIQSGVKLFAFMKTQKSTPSYAPFDLFGDRLRLSSFKRSITPNKASMILPFESICSLFKNEDSKCFMVITNKKEEGHVTMRISKQTFWGQQFISLCLGDFGPSLRNTCFFRSCGKGKPGHHIWGGDYSKNDGNGGEPFLPINEPLKQNLDSIVKGLISARYGSNDRSTIFRIYITGDQSTNLDQPTKDNFCFGYVEEGMDFLEFFANQADISKTIVKDAGCFLDLK